MWMPNFAALIYRQTSINWERVADSAKAGRSGAYAAHRAAACFHTCEAQLPGKCKAAVKPYAATLLAAHSQLLPARASVLPVSSNELFSASHARYFISGSAIFGGGGGGGGSPRPFFDRRRLAE